MLQDARERKDMIKDVNIALSKLDRIIEWLNKPERIHPDGLAKRHSALIKQELNQAYNEYMKTIGEDPDIRLAEGETKGIESSKRVEMYTRKNDFSQENR